MDVAGGGSSLWPLLGHGAAGGTLPGSNQLTSDLWEWLILSAEAA